MLDAAVPEILNLREESCSKYVQADLAMGCLFAHEIVIPDVFLFNSPTLERHILDGKQRSMFSEAVSRGVIRIFTREPVFQSYDTTLKVISEDTTEVAPMLTPISIQPRSPEIAGRLATTAPTPQTKHLASSGDDSWVATLATL
ncbi:hypothetical protein AB0C11_39825 [Streptomyces sp. NPDC039016]|uniref:hypothetical protein n=1 Tax=Streptomyces sp. NPDC039016 TaxID=3154330 RepID=UPI00340138EA